jgi:hypothetical protein
MSLLICLVAALIMPNIIMILDSTQLGNIFALFKEFIKSIFNGTVTEGYGDRFKDAFAAFYEFVKLKSGRIILSGFFFIVIYIIGSFLNGISNYALGVMINDHMSSLSHLGFTQSLIRDLKNAFIYEITYIGITIIYDALTVIICFNILFGLFNVFGIFSIFLSSTLFVGLIALKLTYVSGMMPAMITDKTGIKKAIKSSFSLGKKQSQRMFSTYLVSIYLILFFNVSMAIFTLFSSLLITVPISLLLIICIKFVGYYSINDKKYFINYDNIIIPKNLREEEKLLEDIDI